MLEKQTLKFPSPAAAGVAKGHGVSYEVGSSTHSFLPLGHACPFCLEHGHHGEHSDTAAILHQEEGSGEL